MCVLYNERKAMKKWVKIALIVVAVVVAIAIVVMSIWIFALDNTLGGLG